MPVRKRTTDTLTCAHCAVSFPYKQSGKTPNRFCGWDCLQASRTPEGRFWVKVNKDGPVPDACPELGSCWCWTGSLFTDSGYGQFWLNNTNRRAHIVSYEWANGPIPEDIDGRQVQHLCNVRVCVRPSHLALGMPPENMQYASLTGRMAHGERHHRAVTTEDSVRLYRRLASEGVPQSVLAEQANMSRSAMHSLLKGETWKHVT